MRRARSLVPLVALAAAACTKNPAGAPVNNLRQPAGIAVFRGLTLDDPNTIRPYIVVANAAANDLALFDGVDDTPVLAPIQLRTLVLPVPDRPVQLIAASLHDDGPVDKRADLLVAVTAGSSVLQLVRTWDPDNAVLADPPSAVDLGADILALAVLESSAGTARLVAALAGRQLAVVEYARDADQISIDPVGFQVQVVQGASAPEPFQPLALATVPGDPDHVYAATIDVVDLDGALAPVHGVAEIDVSGAGPWPVRAIDARGPTRLVAAARVRERRSDSVADDEHAFDGQPLVPRVYAVLDESGCGLGRRIDCGVAMLDPVAGGLPLDWAGRMPYRAPIRLPGRPEAIAASQPPANPPSDAASDAIYAGDFMRLQRGETTQATTGVAAVAASDGFVYFLDLGRFNVVTVSSPLASTNRGVSVVAPTRSELERRLWVEDPSTGAFATTRELAADFVTVTPGYTTDDTWAVTYQGILPALESRPAEAGKLPTGEAWFALQIGEDPPPGSPAGTPRHVTQAVRLFHPAMGVHAGPSGDLAVVQGSGIADCDTFEARIDAFLEPAPEFPGGAVVLAPEGDDTCLGALYGAIADGGVQPSLTATIRARELVMTGAIAGYGGRPQLDQEYSLAYPAGTDEDALAALCPLADWDGSLPAPTCADPCTRDVCEELVLARKARRYHHLSNDCGGDADCETRWGPLSATFPAAYGPVLQFQVGIQNPGGTETLRDEHVILSIASGVVRLLARPSAGSPNHPSGAVAFDRSPDVAAAGYRFFFSYSGDVVLDASPSVTPLAATTIR